MDPFTHPPHKTQRWQEAYPGAPSQSEAKLGRRPTSYSSQSNRRRDSACDKWPWIQVGTEPGRGAEHSEVGRTERLPGWGSTVGGMCVTQNSPWLQCGPWSGGDKSGSGGQAGQVCHRPRHG